jgi:hypothetical protein
MVKTILLLAANPKDTSRLRLDQEVREIDSGLQRALKRDDFILKQIWAVRPSDFRRAMLDFKPNIVHFCGHGAGSNGIAFENDEGNATLVNAETLGSFFELFSNNVECVVLNACYSEDQSAEISHYIPFVVGMSNAVKDTTAIEFAVSFYDALGAGESIEFAYKLACNAIYWSDNKDDSNPILKIRQPQARESLEQNSITKAYEVSPIEKINNISSILNTLDNLVALNDVKAFIHGQTSRILLEQRRNINNAEIPPSLGSLIFSGNPGTGKTMIARLYSQALFQLGYLKKGHIVAVTESDLIAGYVGQTGLKTREAVERAIDGVLYVDDIHAIVSKDHYGQEAIDELVPAMEIYKHRILFIYSGYQENIDKFLKCDPGLPERIAHIINFPDYTVKELVEILDLMAFQRGFNIPSKTKIKAEAYFTELAKQSRLIGNANLVRNLLDQMEIRCAERIFRDNIDVESRPIILPDDIPSISS